MPSDRKTRKVNVHASKTASGWQFRMEEVDAQSGRSRPCSRLNFSKTDDEIYKRGHHWVEFHLVRPPSTDLRFHDDWREVFWIGEPVEPDPSRPDEYCCAPYSLRDKEVRLERKNDLLLAGKNHNKTCRELAFNLGFQDGDDPTRIAFDPGWGNNNGGIDDPISDGGFARAIGLVTALTGLAALGAWAVRRSQSEGPKRSRAKRR